MTEQEIAELRSRIQELSERDEDFARRSNLLLDEIVLTRDQADKNTRAIDNLARASAESRRDIDQLAERMGELAQSVSDLRETQQLTQFIVEQLARSVSELRQSQQIMLERLVSSDQQANADRAIMLQILQFLQNQYPGNGRG